MESGCVIVLRRHSGNISASISRALSRATQRLIIFSPDSDTMREAAYEGLIDVDSNILDTVPQHNLSPRANSFMIRLERRPRF